MLEFREVKNIEEWRDIKGYEGLYQVSNLGNVRSIVADSSRRKRIMKSYNHNGYRRLNLYKNKKVKKYYIHRLVALHFILNPSHYLEVNHIDGNKSNNHYTNLEWCTSSQNQIHAYRTKLQISNKSKKCEVINIETKESIIFYRMKDACEFLGKHYNFISTLRKKSTYPLEYNGYLIKEVV